MEIAKCYLARKKMVKNLMQSLVISTVLTFNLAMLIVSQYRCNKTIAIKRNRKILGFSSLMKDENVFFHPKTRKPGQ
jgi:hypothetical protein